MGAAVLFAGGCMEYEKEQARVDVDERLVTWYYDSAISNAVIRQRTLFPHQFTTQSSELNELGRRDLAILAAYFKDRPGTINVRRGSASDELYQQRVDTVRQGLQDAGVQSGRVVIKDGLPAGDGMPGERVLTVLESDAPQQSAASYTIKSISSGN
jgi:hypothetical protein